MRTETSDSKMRTETADSKMCRDATVRSARAKGLTVLSHVDQCQLKFALRQKSIAGDLDIRFGEVAKVLDLRCLAKNVIMYGSLVKLRC